MDIYKILAKLDAVAGKKDLTEGAVGAATGGAIGRAVGAAGGPVGSMVGGIVGSAAGNAIGDKLSEGSSMLQRILSQHAADVEEFEESGELSNNLYEALFEYYMETGEMPYGVAKARDGDPYNWIADRLEGELGVNESAELDEVFPGTPEYELRFGKDDASSAFDKKKVSTGTVYSRKHFDEPEAGDDDTPRKAGRPTGTGRKLGAKGPGVDSKLLKGKGGLKETEAAAFKPGDRVMYMNTFATIITCDGETCGIKVDKHPGTMMVPTSQVKKPSYDEDVSEAGYSAKAARAGKDIGKPGKNFAKIAKGAAERYGSKAAGERVAGAVLNKLRHPANEGEMTEVAAPGQEDWIKKNKARFIDQYGEEKGKRILYATAQKRSKKNEAAPAQPNDKEDKFDAQALAQHKRKLGQEANRRKMAPKPMEENGMGGTVAGGVAPAPGAKTFAEASSESHTSDWKAAGKAVHAILKKVGYKGSKTEKGYMWTKETPKGTAFVDIDFDERDPEVVAWGEGELKGAKDKSYWQSGSGNIGEIADKIAELFANVKPGEMPPKEMDEANKDGKKPDADKDGVPDWADKKPGKDDNEESDESDDDGDKALKKMKSDAGIEDKDDSDDKEESDDKPKKGEKPNFGRKDDDSEESDEDDSEDEDESDDEESDDKEEKTESEDKPKKDTSGTPYGKSVYESAFKKSLKKQLTESISMNTSEDDNGHKSVTVTATDEDAGKLGEMLKMAGMFSSGGYSSICPSCGTSGGECGHEHGADHVDEDLANAPDETYSSMDTILNKLSGGLNGPKTTGQTTTPIINRDVKRQGPSIKTTITDVKEEAESKLWKLYKKYDTK